MKTIYDVVDPVTAMVLPAPAPRPMPKQLGQLGCGRHRFKEMAGGAAYAGYRCTTPGCDLIVRPGMLLYSHLHAWMTNEEAPS